MIVHEVRTPRRSREPPRNASRTIAVAAPDCNSRVARPFEIPRQRTRTGSPRSEQRDGARGMALRNDPPREGEKAIRRDHRKSARRNDRCSAARIGPPSAIQSPFERRRLNLGRSSPPATRDQSSAVTASRRAIRPSPRANGRNGATMGRIRSGVIPCSCARCDGEIVRWLARARPRTVDLRLLPTAEANQVIQRRRFTARRDGADHAAAPSAVDRRRARRPRHRPTWVGVDTTISSATRNGPCTRAGAGQHPLDELPAALDRDRTGAKAGTHAPCPPISRTVISPRRLVAP